jgi:hypothetical protein
MERTKAAGTVLEKPWWQKVGGGSLRMGNKIIKPGQKFQADPEEISESFRNFVIPVSANATFKTTSHLQEKKEVKVAAPVYEKQLHGKSLFLFDVVNTTTGKVQNTKSMKEEAADKLIEDLSK